MITELGDRGFHSRETLFNRRGDRHAGSPTALASDRRATCRIVERGTGYLMREVRTMIRKLKSGKYRLYSRRVDSKTGERKNLGTFDTREAAEQHERTVQYFKHKH